MALEGMMPDSTIPTARFLYNNKEFEAAGGVYFFGARMYAPDIGRWLGVDPLASSYPAISPYAYVLNNPINAIDPDGRDVILVIWTTGTGDNGVGHAGIAVSNYKQETYIEIINDVEVEKTRMVADGTFTLYENWPGGDGVNFDLKGAITSR